MGKNDHDLRVIRCRMLGHEVTFAYCRAAGRKMGATILPCHKLLDCWFEAFAVEEFLRKYYSEEQIELMLAPPPPKLATIIELAQKAREDNPGEKGS